MGRSALYAAAVFSQCYDIVEVLLHKGAEIDIQTTDGISLLIATCHMGSYEIVELLLKNGAKPDVLVEGQSALMCSSFSGHHEVAELLLNHGADPNLQNSSGKSAIFSSILGGHHEITKLLLDRGADVKQQTTDGWSPLLCASLEPKIPTLEVLLEYGADPDQRHLDSRFPLMLATIHKQYEFAQFLLDHGADPNLQVLEGYSALLISIFMSYDEIAKLLLARGAQPTLQIGEGYSALTKAISMRRHEIIKPLLGSTQVKKLDLWCALKMAVNVTQDSVTTALLFQQCLQVVKSNKVFVVDSDFPGVVFWDAPIHHCITSQGATIQSPHTGISLSIPEQALSSTEKDVDLLIHPCLNGPFELPAGYESASPAYLIQPNRRVDIHKDVTLRIHHYASLQSEEDCKEMTFFSASPTLLYRQSKPVYIFKEMIQSPGVFRPNSPIGEIVVKHFCFVNICRRRRLQEDAASMYSVRLYRSSLKDGVSAIFCMCPYNPFYIKHCDLKISEKYQVQSCELEGPGRSDHLAKMTAGSVTLVVRNSEGWKVRFDKTPTTIRKRDLDIPQAFSELTDYPPRFLIFAHPTGKGTCSDSPQLVVQGLDVEDCSFEIITPGSSRSTSTSDSQSIPNSLSSEASTSVSSAERTTPTEQNPSRDPSLSLKYILTELVTISKEWLKASV